MNAHSTSAPARSFLFVNKSCNRRQEEIGRAADFLALNGYSKTYSYRKADFIFLFTCAFCQGKVREMLDHLENIRSRKKDSAEVIVGSCLPKTDPKSLRDVFDGKTLIPTDFSALNTLPGITTRIEDMPPLFGPDVQHTAEAGHNGGDSPVPLAARLRHRIRAEGLRGVTLKTLQDGGHRLVGGRKRIFLAAGCVRKCSYCAIRFATGRLRSKPLPWVLQQFEEGLKAGCRKFDLYADSIGEYGQDVGTNLGELFAALGRIQQAFSIGIYDLHPVALMKHFDTIMALCREGRVHYLYVPVQSGNPRILRLMNRAVDTAGLRQNLLKVKKTPKNFLQTSVIVGFPSETEAEFADTLNLLKDVDFDHCYIHCYTDMPGTESSQMPGKVDKEVMLDRIRRVEEAGIKHNVGDTTKEWEKISD